MTCARYGAPYRSGLTLSELLVVGLIIAIAIALLLPGLLSTREQARQRTCEARISGLMQSVQVYESTTGAFPAGVVNPNGPVEHVPSGMHHGWICQLLPFLDEQVLFDKIDPNVSIYDQRHDEIHMANVTKWKCPAAPPRPSASSYAACHNDVETPIDERNTGVFFLNRRVTTEDVHDGLKHTLFLGEKTSARDDLGWYSGTRASLRNTHEPPRKHREYTPSESPKLSVGGFGSWHAGYSHLAMGDGRIAFTNHRIDPIVYRQLGHRADGTTQSFR